jgi:hypothetical protein
MRLLICVFFYIFLNIEKRISYREFVISAIIGEDPDPSFSLSISVSSYINPITLI